MAQYHRVSIEMTCQGQAITNVLWYWGTTNWSSLLDYTGFTDALVAELRENIWYSTSSPTSDDQYKMANLLPNDLSLTQWVVQSYTDAFALVTGLPQVYPDSGDGLRSPEHGGPATCAIIRTNLSPGFGPGIGLPRRGYLAVGPVCDDMTDEAGRLNSTWLPRWQGWADRLAAPIITESPAQTLLPIRVRLTRVAGLITDISYRAIASCSVRELTSFRRSRMPEA